MKKIALKLLVIFLHSVPAMCQPEYVALTEIKKIADLNATALWGSVSSDEPVAYYSTDNELIGYRFNFAIGKAFPKKENLMQQCEEAQKQGNNQKQWGMDEYGRMFVSARKDIGVIQDYSKTLSPEYVFGSKMEALALLSLGSNVWLNKVYYVNFVNQWFCYTNGLKDVYINVFPKTQVVNREKFLEITQSMPFFCAKGDYSEEWQAYQTGIPMASKAEVWIPNPEMCRFYDWSYGCTPTATAMLLSWWDYNSANTVDNYSRLIDIYFQRWDGIQGSGETDYQVPNILRELAIHMNTDTINNGTTEWEDIDPGITEVCNLFNYNNYSFYASTYTAHDVEWYFNKIASEIGTFQRPVLNHIVVGNEAHTECCVAYDESTDMLGIHNTWSPGVDWIHKDVLIGCTKVEAGGALGLAVQLDHPLGDTAYNHNGNGEVFFANDACEIRWTSEDEPGAYAKLSYSVDSGYHWTNITQNTPNDGVYDWHVPFVLNSENCRVHVSLYLSDDVFAGADASLGNFTIVPGGNIEQLQTDIIDYSETDPDYYNFSHGYTTWCVVGARAHDDTEWWDIEMFDDDSFQDQLAISHSLNRVEFVVMDGHHSTLSKSIKVNRLIGDNNAIVEFEGENEMLAPGVNNLEWPAFDVVEMFDLHLTPDTYTFFLSGINIGDPNLDFALFGSNNNAYYAGRQDYLAISDNAGINDEVFTVEITTEDDYGLCVWANDNNSGNYIIRIENRETWTGAYNSDWRDEANWNLNYIPDEYTDVIIPAGTPHSPIINYVGVAAFAKNLEIEAGATLMCMTELNVYENFVSEGQFFMMGFFADLGFYGSGNVSWSDPGSDDIYENVYVLKDIEDDEVEMLQNMNLGGKFYIGEGTFKIEEALILDIGNTEQDAFRIANGGHLYLTNNPEINVAGGIVFNDGSGATVASGMINCGGDFLVENNDANDIVFTGGTLVMTGSSDQSINDQDDGNLELHNLTVNKTGTCNIGVDHLTVTGDLRVEEGIFNLNGFNVLCSGDVDILTGGTLTVDEYADLRVGQNHILSVHDGGLLKVVGTHFHNAKITVHPEGSGTYTFEVLNGGTISARHGIFERMDAFGVNLYSGAQVDPANPFNYCTFRDGAAGNAALLFIQNEQDFMVEEAEFPDNTWGGQYNVWKSNNSGRVVFAGATGSFSGPDFENDPNSLVDWMPIFWKVDLDLMLEGPFNGINMDANLTNRLPEYQPYEPILPYFDNPMPEWYHSGEEYVLSVPNSDIVDWVVVELRDAPTVQQALPGTAIDKRAAFLNKSGQIVSLDGFSPLSITSTFAYNPYAVVWHRNHLGIISAYPLTQTKGTLTYDFTTEPNKTYGGTEAVKELAPGIWGMISGDCDGNGIINIADKTNAWDTEAGSVTYSGCDVNMDLHINNLDKNDFWASNINRHSFIPDAFGCGEALVDSRDGQIYPTVQIGTQCWMAQNLNLGQRIDGAQQQLNNGNFEKYCYYDVETNCSEYGGLYQWNEMMQYSGTPGSQGICPDDWHIPTGDEFETLVTFLGGTDVAGGKMKEAGLLHWSAPNTGATNESGFTGLPGGYAYFGFSEISSNGYFWSSTDLSSNAYYTRLVYSNTLAYLGGTAKVVGLSVRCLRNINLPPEVPSNPSPENGAINQPLNTILSWSCSDPENDPLTYDVYFGDANPPELVSVGQTSIIYNPGTLNQNTTYYWKIIAMDNHGNAIASAVWSFITQFVWTCGDPLIDTRDMQSYNTVQIGTQCWMAENLNIGTIIQGSSTQMDNGNMEKYCYDDNEANCSEYGGLYQWDEMMQYSTQPGIQGICPAEWHIPSNEEWTTLIDFLGGVNIAGGKMKETGTVHWIADVGATNESGFTALPGGSHNGFGIYYHLGENGFFWTSTEYLFYTAWYLSLSYNNTAVYRYNNDKVFGYSVRCVKN